MNITQKIIPRLDQQLLNYSLYPCHIHTLRMVLSDGLKKDWGSQENNDLVNECYRMFSNIASQLDEQVIIKKLEDGTYGKRENEK